MNKIKFLEQEWFRIKSKSLLIKISLLTVLLTISFTLYTIFYSKIDFKKFLTFQEQNTTLTQTPIIETIPTPLIIASITPSPTPFDAIVHIKEIYHSVKDSHNLTQEPTYPADIVEQMVEKEPVQEQIQEPIQEKEKPQMVFVADTQKDFLTILAEKYSKAPTYATAIAIAEEYFKNDNFQEALNWSIKANELDDKNEESWIIFAKSKEKLLKVDEAINSLRVYLSKNQSPKIEELLTQLTKQNKTIQTPSPSPSPSIVPIATPTPNLKVEKNSSINQVEELKKSYYAKPSAQEALYLAKGYYKIQNYKNCMFWANKLIEHLPNNEAGYIYYATCGLEERYFSKSLQLLNIYLQKEPNNEKIKSLINKLEKAKAKE